MADVSVIHYPQAIGMSVAPSRGVHRICGGAMKRAGYWLLFGFAVIPAWALPMPCIDNTLTAYIAPGFACTIGDKSFGSFATILSSSAVLGGMATPATADDITVHP